MTNIGKIVLIISLFLIIISGGCIEKKSLVEQLSEPKSTESFDTSIENGLVGEWRFDGNAQDSSGNGYHGTIYGANFVEGISGKALQFDGKGDVVLTNNFPVYANEPFTIETWVYPASTSNDYNTIIGHNRHYPDNVYSRALLSGVPSQADKWTIFMPSPGYLYGSTHGINQWYHLAVVFDGSRVSLYVNGVIDINPVAANYGDQNIPVAIGRFYYDLSGSSFNGIIDEVRIYNRALSAEEIKAEYSKYAGKVQTKTKSYITPTSTSPGRTPTTTSTKTPVTKIPSDVVQAGEWPMFRHDAAHTGATGEVVEPPLELLWKYKTGDWVYNSPAVSGGVVYVGSSDGYVYALDASTGSLKWKYETGGEIYSSPAVSSGVVYAGSKDGYVYAFASASNSKARGRT